jgi:hypothetical protein
VATANLLFWSQLSTQIHSNAEILDALLGGMGSFDQDEGRVERALELMMAALGSRFVNHPTIPARASIGGKQDTSRIIVAAYCTFPGTPERASRPKREA